MGHSPIIVIGHLVGHPLELLMDKSLFAGMILVHMGYDDTLQGMPLRAVGAFILKSNLMPDLAVLTHALVVVGGAVARIAIEAQRMPVLHLASLIVFNRLHPLLGMFASHMLHHCRHILVAHCAKRTAELMLASVHLFHVGQYLALAGHHRVAQIA